VGRVCLTACLAVLVGCAAPKVYIASDYVSAGKMAVLPMSNESNDLDGPIYLRRLLNEGLASRGFQLLAAGDIDEALKVQGFTDGGQLHATTPQKLGEWTGADTLLYSTIENFDYINVGFYAQRRVKIAAKLVSAKTGVRLWETEQEGVTRTFAGNRKDAERMFAAQLAIKAVEKMAHTPLQAESRMAVHRLLSTLPYR
jgi:hypothetical protein